MKNRFGQYMRPILHHQIRMMQHPLLFFQDIMFSQFTAVERPQTVRQCDCTIENFIERLLPGRRSYQFYDIFTHDVINAAFFKDAVLLSQIFTSQFVSCITVDFQCCPDTTAIGAGQCALVRFHNNFHFRCWLYRHP